MPLLLGYCTKSSILASSNLDFISKVSILSSVPVILTLGEDLTQTVMQVQLFPCSLILLFFVMHMDMLYKTVLIKPGHSCIQVSLTLTSFIKKASRYCLDLHWSGLFCQGRHYCTVTASLLRFA